MNDRIDKVRLIGWMLFDCQELIVYYTSGHEGRPSYPGREAHRSHNKLVSRECQSDQEFVTVFHIPPYQLLTPFQCESHIRHVCLPSVTVSRARSLRRPNARISPPRAGSRVAALWTWISALSPTVKTHACSPSLCNQTICGARQVVIESFGLLFEPRSPSRTYPTNH